MMNYKLHNKANNLMQLHRDMKDRILFLEKNNHIHYWFADMQDKHFKRIDTCKRGLERIEQAYIKVLTEILAV